jgi:hypothetical protein
MVKKWWGEKRQGLIFLYICLYVEKNNCLWGKRFMSIGRILTVTMLNPCNLDASHHALVLCMDQHGRKKHLDQEYQNDSTLIT